MTLSEKETSKPKGGAAGEALEHYEMLLEELAGRGLGNRLIGEEEKEESSGKPGAFLGVEAKTVEASQFAARSEFFLTLIFIQSSGVSTPQRGWCEVED